MPDETELQRTRAGGDSLDADLPRLSMEFSPMCSQAPVSSVLKDCPGFHVCSTGAHHAFGKETLSS